MGPFTRRNNSLYRTVNVKRCVRSVLLASTHVVCERLSTMHEQARLPEVLDHFLQEYTILARPRIPSPQIEIGPELGTLGFHYGRIPPPHLKLKFGKRLQLECMETNHCIPQRYRLVFLLWQIFSNADRLTNY